MKQYVLRRVALAVPTLFLVSIIVFSMMRLMPGDVVIRMVEGHAYAPTLDALRAELGLDRPVYVQYLEWIGGIVAPRRLRRLVLDAPADLGRVRAAVPRDAGAGRCSRSWSRW